ncbi:hypothetical protein [Paludisphaera mucosa]|uniref:Glycosyltransferase RgtA/B/C/D-like domain-containing protein n=1 Tax=Paludisphaera mucosa TaxID=3030827 RepID=A0ABT6FJX5_9BACT|nr:hypothetical protein [Paludisphaera mucosa]MDG3007882.1 hypothetical protein [Paludisphaera mucosa]
MKILRLVLLAAGAAGALIAASLARDVLPLMLPRVVLNHPVEWAFGAVLFGRLLIEEWVRRRGTDARWGGALDRLDAASSWAIRRGLFLGLAAWTCVRMAAWLPHYPFWPWCRDVDNYAVFEMSWEAGELPYRDVRAFNFPGHIYLHWILGKVFGRGRPGVFYMVDAAALLTLGGTLLGWSRKRLGALLPGMFSYFVFLAAYFDMQIELVAERDWHAGLGGTLALLTLQAWPGRRGRWISALLTATAFTIRPQVVLFLPALGLATLLGDGEDEPSSLRAGAARLAEWAFAFALFVAAGFAPLAIAGVLDDLVRGLRVVSYGGPYSTFTPARAIELLGEELGRPTTAALLASLTALSVRGPLKNLARVWLTAVVGVLAYRPLSPVAHEYLKTPLTLVEAIAWALPVAWCIRAVESSGVGRRTFLGLLAVLLLLYESVPTREPYNCSFPASLDAIRAAVRSGWPDVPPGAWVWFSPTRAPNYPWDDYQRLLQHLREKTGPDTIVANVLKQMPLPPVNGPAGRRSPFRVEAGITWMWMIREDLDEQFARELRQAGEDSVVVWVPSEADDQTRLPLRRLTQVIRDEYKADARFGPIEVWRRRARRRPSG